MTALATANPALRARRDGARTRHTRATLARELRDLGLRAGHTVIAHASLRSIGWIEGGAQALVDALLDVIGPSGTLVVPAFTSANSLTSRLYRERVRGLSGEDQQRYRSTMPPFDKATSSSIECGWLSESVRSHPAAVRSDHPQTSFAAIGADAAWLMAGHDLRSHLGEESPLRKLYDLDAQIVLIGVGFDTCTAFHLAEYRYCASPPRSQYGCVITKDGRPTWEYFWDVILDDTNFADCGSAFEREKAVIRGWVGRAPSRRMSFVEAVDFAEGWLLKWRSDNR